MDTPFKYTSHFESAVKASCAQGSCKRWGISKASLENLKPLIPPEVDLSRNIDLLGVAFNAALVNQFNKNGDGIDTQTAVAIKDYFINKPTNIEHNKERVVGHVISASFSNVETNELVDEESIAQVKGPFNIALGALVYKVVNPAFARMLEQTDEGEEFHNIISASWEIGFNDYYIAVGSNDLREAEIITDKIQIKEFKKYLQAYDGKGTMDDGTLVNRLVIGDIYPLGIGFTAHPAAAVRGVIVENEQQIEIKKEDGAAEFIHVNNMDNWKNLPQREKNISLSEKNDVNKSNALIMDTQDLLKQIEDMLSEKLGDGQHSKEAVAGVSNVMMDAIKQKDELWQKEREEKENAISDAKERHEVLSTEVEEVKEKLIATEKQLEELAEEKRLREAKDRFNSRMGVVCEAFDLNDEDLMVVAADISELDSDDETFEAYQGKLKVMWEHKTKAHREEQEEQFKSRLEEEVQKRLAELNESNASEETPDDESREAVEEVLENVEEETSAAITNNNEAACAEEISLREKFHQAFTKENITVKY